MFNGIFDSMAIASAGVSVSRRGMMTCLCCMLLMQDAPAYGTSPTAPPTSDHELSASQQNTRSGPRQVPARVIPLPSDIDSKSAALVAAPYARLWNADPVDDGAWRQLQRTVDRQILSSVTRVRARLGVSIKAISIGGVRAYLLVPRQIPEAHRRQLIFHLHPGAYVLGAGESGTMEATLLAAYGGYRVLSIDYRMPPDSPYPAALDDAVSAWRAIVKTTDARQIAVEGTSAGGGLVLALMLRLKAEGLPLPAAIAPGSPWADMTQTGDSYRTNEWIDNVLVSYSGYISHAAKVYAHGHNFLEPGLSPIYGDFSGFPPAILTTGTRDLFLSNTVRVHRKLREAGVKAELQVFEGLSHAQFALNPDAPVTKEAYGEIAGFFDTHLAH